MIAHYYCILTLEQRAEPQWNLDNLGARDSFFRQCRIFELSHYDGNGPPPPNKDSLARRIW
jgi:hypothetical protein